MQVIITKRSSSGVYEVPTVCGGYVEVSGSWNRIVEVGMLMVVAVTVVIIRHHNFVLQPGSDRHGSPGDASHTLRMGNGFSSKPPVIKYRLLPLICDIDRLWVS